MLTDSVFKTAKNYYPLVFSEEHKYIVKDKKIHKYINDDLDFLMNLMKNQLMYKSSLFVLKFPVLQPPKMRIL